VAGGVYSYFAILGGLRKFEGTGLQGALPPYTFRALLDLFSVSFECCASPFNCYFGQYCSAFNDIDRLFGSTGSFLNFRPVRGSFEINPPFSEQFMIAMVHHISSVLSQSVEPLSFIVFIPEWQNPPTPAIGLLSVSAFLRKDFVVSASDHEYFSGYQHYEEQRERFFRPVHETHVFFLQNEAGFREWMPTDEKILKLKEIMMKKDSK